MFTLKHVIILVISIILIVSLSIFSRKLNLKQICKIMLIVGIISEIIKIFCYILMNEETHGGTLPKSDLPFHLCSIQILFFVIINVINNDKINRFLFSFMIPSCLIGGVAALLIPTSSSLNVWPITIQYNLYHISIIVFAIYLLMSKEFTITIKDYFNCLKMLLIMFFFAIYINSIVYDGVSNINFMYVVSPPQAGLPFLNENNGWLTYICHYAFLVIFCVTACYIKPIIKAIKSK